MPPFAPPALLSRAYSQYHGLVWCCGMACHQSTAVCFAPCCEAVAAGTGMLCFCWCNATMHDVLVACRGADGAVGAVLGGAGRAGAGQAHNHVRPVTGRAQRRCGGVSTGAFPPACPSAALWCCVGPRGARPLLQAAGRDAPRAGVALPGVQRGVVFLTGFWQGV